jgi:hypothetical protein
MADYRGLGFDPTPGELGAVTEAASRFRAAADAIADVEPSLRRAGELSQGWQGNAADAFRARLREAPEGDAERLRRAADALDGWAGTLLANKRRAEELDEPALRLRERLRSAQDLLQDKQNARDLAGGDAAAEAAVASVTTLITDLETELDKVLDKARRLSREHQRAADAIADELGLLRGEQVDRPVGPQVGRIAATALERTARTAGALAGMLLPSGAIAVPGGGSGALAAAITSSEPR